MPALDHKFVENIPLDAKVRRDVRSTKIIYNPKKDLNLLFQRNPSTYLLKMLKVPKYETSLMTTVLQFNI